MSEDITTDVTESTTEATLSTTDDWKSGLSEELRSDASLNDIKDIESLAKSYVHAQKELGGRIRIPGEDASPEARDSFFKQLENVAGVARIDAEDKSDLYNKLGRPETAEGYKVDTPEGLELDSNRLSQYAEVAHKAGLSNSQFNELVQMQITEAQQELEAMENSRVSGENKLKEVWGQDYENRLASAQAAAKVYSDKYPEAMQELLQSPAANNPAVLAMFSELHKSLQESGAVNPASQGQVYGMTPGEAQDAINEIRSNRAHPYHNSRDPGHSAAVEKMQKLYAALNH